MANENRVNQQNFREKAKEAAYSLRKKGVLEGEVLHEALKFYELQLHALELRVAQAEGKAAPSPAPLLAPPTKRSRGNA